MVTLDKVDYALKVIDGRIFPKTAEVLVPCQVSLLQNVVGKDSLKPVLP